MPKKCASIPFELATATLFVNKFFQLSFKAVKKPTIKWNDYQFYAKLHEVFGIETPSNSSDIFFEMLSFLQPDCCSGGRHHFKITK